MRLHVESSRRRNLTHIKAYLKRHRRHEKYNYNFQDIFVKSAPMILKLKVTGVKVLKIISEHGN